MANALRLLYKILLLLAVIFTVNCSRDDDKADTEQAKTKRSEEVRDSLDGEIIFYNNNLAYRLRKVSAHSGGTGNVIGQDASVQIGPKWSQDGSKIAFIKLISAAPGQIADWLLAIISKDGLEQNEWLLGPSDQIDIKAITWSPVGLFIAVLCSNNKILYVGVTSGEITVTQLQSGAFEDYTSLAWCPVGNKIAISSVSGNYGSEHNSIWLFPGFDNNPQNDPGNLLITWQSSGVLPITVECMDWSPDGSMLAYSDIGGYEHIYIINYDGTKNREIILKDLYKDDKVLGFAPCWAKNNKQIVYTGITGVSGSSLIFGLFVAAVNGSYRVDIKIPGELPDWY